MLRALIVDDEPPARAELRYQLERYPDVQVIGEAANAREAWQLLEALPYDVVFLDVQMPGLNGLELARQLGAKPLERPFIVFVTAYDQYAVPAFGLNAVDYLLKPVSRERLAETLDRLRSLMRGAASERSDAARRPASPEPAEYPQYVAASEGEKTIPLRLSEVSYFAAEGDQVFVYTRDRRRHLVRTTLQALERQLPPHIFFRCHRSFIVNIHEISEIIPFFNGTFTLKMRGNPQEDIPVSRNNAKKLRDLFGFSAPAGAR